MSLRGIDAQILVTKTAELTAERARQLKLNETLTEQAGEQLKHQIEQDQNRTQAAAHIEGRGISADEKSPEGGRSGPESDGEQARERASEENRDTPDLRSLPVERGEKTRQKNYTFDISV